MKPNLPGWNPKALTWPAEKPKFGYETKRSQSSAAWLSSWPLAVKECMNILAYFLIVVGILLFGSIGYDELRGVTSSPTDTPGDISKQGEPENFHNAIVCHCYYAGAFLFLGILMLVIDKSVDKSDPESPDFAGNKALDDWARAMKEEEDRRKISKK